MDRRCRLPVAAFQPRRAFGIRKKSGLSALIAVSFLFGGFCFTDTAELPTSRDNSLFEPEPPFDFNSADLSDVGCGTTLDALAAAMEAGDVYINLHGDAPFGHTLARGQVPGGDDDDDKDDDDDGDDDDGDDDDD